jgi:hypothetical protein
VQVGPIKPTLKAPGIKRLQLKCDEPLSIIAFNLKMRRYTKARPQHSRLLLHVRRAGRGLHSSTSQLNLSRFYQRHPLTPPRHPSSNPCMHPVSRRKRLHLAKKWTSVSPCPMAGCGAQAEGRGRGASSP